ncbi:MAG: M23 family metallopeptidase [Anaerolineales bacterium]|nr:M23 family metallopeptidase [Anaerolineales bacterium]
MEKKPVHKKSPANKTQRSDNSKSIQTAALLQQIGLNMLMVGLVALLAYLAWQRLSGKPLLDISLTGEEPRAAGGGIAPQAAELSNTFTASLNPMAQPPSAIDSVVRKTNLKTIIPSRPRVNVITYTVQTGDTLFLIAQNFGIKPATLLFGNYAALQDNPHLLKPKQVLNILPVDGAYYEWKEGDNLADVAASFNVDPQVILDYPGNFIDLTTTDITGKGIEPGTWLIIPGGTRPIKDWGPPAISRTNPAVARYYGEGACGSVYSGAIGTGTFIWPTTDHTISGYTFDSSTHPAVDIGGAEGNPIYASDSGVVVFAGWSSYGYGYMIVIDHGNGWQSAYAHLSAVGVSCGQSVYQGGYIGALGNTGNSSGPHLHFELSINGAKVNPLDYIGY